MSTVSPPAGDTAEEQESPYPNHSGELKWSTTLPIMTGPPNPPCELLEAHQHQDKDNRSMQMEALRATRGPAYHNWLWGYKYHDNIDFMTLYAGLMRHQDEVRKIRFDATRKELCETRDARNIMAGQVAMQEIEIAALKEQLAASAHEVKTLTGERVRLQPTSALELQVNEEEILNSEDHVQAAEASPVQQREKAAQRSQIRLLEQVRLGPVNDEQKAAIADAKQKVFDAMAQVHVQHDIKPAPAATAEIGESGRKRGLDDEDSAERATKIRRLE